MEGHDYIIAVIMKIVALIGFGVGSATYLHSNFVTKEYFERRLDRIENKLDLLVWRKVDKQPQNKK